MAGYVWDPKYIRQIISKNAGEVITADEWNNLLNLIINQGDYNTEQVSYLTEMFKVEGNFAKLKDELLEVLSQGPLAPLTGSIVISYTPETEYVTLRCAPTSIGTELDNMYFLDAWTEPAAGLGTLPAYLGDRVFRDGTKFNIVFPQTLKPPVSGLVARLMYGTPDRIPVYDTQTGQPPEEYREGTEYTFTYRHHSGGTPHCWTVSVADEAIATATAALEEAVKIGGVPVVLEDMVDGDMLQYDEAVGAFVPVASGGETYTLLPSYVGAWVITAGATYLDSSGPNSFSILPSTSIPSDTDIIINRVAKVNMSRITSLTKTISHLSARNNWDVFFEISADESFSSALKFNINTSGTLGMPKLSGDMYVRIRCHTTGISTGSTYSASISGIALSYGSEGVADTLFPAADGEWSYTQSNPNGVVLSTTSLPTMLKAEVKLSSQDGTAVIGDYLYFTKASAVDFSKRGTITPTVQLASQLPITMEVSSSSSFAVLDAVYTISGRGQDVSNLMGLKYIRFKYTTTVASGGSAWSSQITSITLS